MRFAVVLVGLVACGGGRAPPTMVTIVDGDDSPPDEGGGCETCPDTAQCAACNEIRQFGCCPDRKCTWTLATDPTPDAPGLGSITCAANGTVPLGGACTIAPAAMGGNDNCVAGTVCVNGSCAQICDINNHATTGCDASHACIGHDGLFANEGATDTPAGVCEATCDPLADNDFDGAGTAHAKTGSACGADPTVGCYAASLTAAPPVFTCEREAPDAAGLTHRAVIASTIPRANDCAPGYTRAFTTDAFGSNHTDCYAFCKPGDAYLGNPNAQAPNGVSPHACNTTDAVGSFGAVPDGGATSNGEHCVYLWYFDGVTDDVGVCWDHSKYRYDSNGDGTIDASDDVLPPCAALPLTTTTGLSAVELGCVSLTTAGLTSPPEHVRRRHTGGVLRVRD